MSTSSVLGVVPKLLPVTATFAAPLALINAYLQVNCIQARMKTKSFLGRDAGTTSKSVSLDGKDAEVETTDPVLIATSMHTNFIENVPLVLIFAGLVELNGGSRKALTYTLGAVALARVSHAIGLLGGRKALLFRQIGFFGSCFPLLGLAGWGTYLVKGYWGL